MSNANRYYGLPAWTPNPTIQQIYQIDISHQTSADYAARRKAEEDSRAAAEELYRRGLALRGTSPQISVESEARAHGMTVERYLNATAEELVNGSAMAGNLSNNNSTGSTLDSLNNQVNSMRGSGGGQASSQTALDTVNNYQLQQADLQQSVNDSLSSELLNLLPYAQNEFQIVHGRDGLNQSIEMLKAAFKNPYESGNLWASMVRSDPEAARERLSELEKEAKVHVVKAQLSVIAALMSTSNYLDRGNIGDVLGNLTMDYRLINATPEELKQAAKNILNQLDGESQDLLINGRPSRGSYMADFNNYGPENISPVEPLHRFIGLFKDLVDKNAPGQGGGLTSILNPIDEYINSLEPSIRASHYEERDPVYTYQMHLKIDDPMKDLNKIIENEKARQGEQNATASDEPSQVSLISSIVKDPHWLDWINENRGVNPTLRSQKYFNSMIEFYNLFDPNNGTLNSFLRDSGLTAGGMTPANFVPKMMSFFENEAKEIITDATTNWDIYKEGGQDEQKLAMYKGKLDLMRQFFLDPFTRNNSVVGNKSIPFDSLMSSMDKLTAVVEKLEKDGSIYPDSSDLNPNKITTRDVLERRFSVLGEDDPLYNATLQYLNDISEAEGLGGPPEVVATRKIIAKIKLDHERMKNLYALQGRTYDYDIEPAIAQYERGIELTLAGRPLTGLASIASAPKPEDFGGLNPETFKEFGAQIENEISNIDVSSNAGRARADKLRNIADILNGTKEGNYNESLNALREYAGLINVSTSLDLLRAVGVLDMVDTLEAENQKQNPLPPEPIRTEFDRFSDFMLNNPIQAHNVINSSSFYFQYAIFPAIVPDNVDITKLGDQYYREEAKYYIDFVKLLNIDENDPNIADTANRYIEQIGHRIVELYGYRLQGVQANAPQAFKDVDFSTLGLDSLFKEGVLPRSNNNNVDPFNPFALNIQQSTLEDLVLRAEEQANVAEMNLSLAYQIPTAAIEFASYARNAADSARGYLDSLASSGASSDLISRVQSAVDRAEAAANELEVLAGLRPRQNNEEAPPVAPRIPPPVPTA